MCSSDLGKNVGDDLREGKITLPVIVSYQRGSDEDRAFWTRCLAGRDVADSDLAHAIALLERHGAIAETMARARHYAEEAKASLAKAPDGAERDGLMEAVDFAVARAT